MVDNSSSAHVAKREYFSILSIKILVGPLAAATVERAKMVPRAFHAAQTMVIVT
jgi:hypothetical protein